MTFIDIQGLCPVCHKDNSLEVIPKKITKADARTAFEEMHMGRDLSKHNMRGTYLKPPIAALWNQHLKTLQWLDMLTVND